MPEITQALVLISYALSAIVVMLVVIAAALWCRPR